jgi:arginine deiminase
MLHRPSWELERITPAELGNVLFDDIPWLRKMQIEHDGFADALRNNSCEVVYFEDVLQDVLQNEKAKQELVRDMMRMKSVTIPKRPKKSAIICFRFRRNNWSAICSADFPCRIFPSAGNP